jgi:hypothetical protein
LVLVLPSWGICVRFHVDFDVDVRRCERAEFSQVVARAHAEIDALHPCGLRVPPPTASFYFKGKLWPRSHGTQATIAEIAKTLGVAYVLDGSVRKSGGRLRVDARLIRADNGYVVWSETYDRPFDDVLMVQDDIAGEVTKALRTSIPASPDR